MNMFIFRTQVSTVDKIIQLQCGGVSRTATRHGRAVLSQTDASGSFPLEERAPSGGVCGQSSRLPRPSTTVHRRWPPTVNPQLGPLLRALGVHSLAPRRRHASARDAAGRRTRPVLWRLRHHLLPPSLPTVLQFTVSFPVVYFLLCRTSFGVPPVTQRSSVVLCATARVAVVCACFA